MTAGRPRKPGKRHPNGDRTEAQIRADQRAEQEEIVRPAIEARMRQFKVSRKIAKTNAMGSPLHRLEHWNMITAKQAIAGHDFASTMRDYLSTAKLQKPTQGKAGFVPTTPDNSDGPPVKGEYWAKRYMDALAEIDRSDPFSAPTSTAVVWKVCIDEIDWPGESALGALRVGLNAIDRTMHKKAA